MGLGWGLPKPARRCRHHWRSWLAHGQTGATASTLAVAEHPVRSALLIGTLGVVSGDIGTSPIYALRASLKAANDASTQATVLGVLSLMFWAIFLIAAVKYVVFVTRADNRGEGGTMSLLCLALPVAGRLQAVLLVVGWRGRRCSSATP